MFLNNEIRQHKLHILTRHVVLKLEVQFGF